MELVTFQEIVDLGKENNKEVKVLFNLYHVLLFICKLLIVQYLLLLFVV